MVDGQPDAFTKDRGVYTVTETLPLRVGGEGLWVLCPSLYTVHLSGTQTCLTTLRGLVALRTGIGKSFALPRTLNFLGTRNGIFPG